MPSLFTNLRGVFSSIVSVGGPKGPQFSATDPTHIGVRNNTDTAFGNMQAADPALPDDLVTLRFLGGSGGGGMKTIFVPVLAAVNTSTTIIPTASTVLVNPNGSYVMRVKLLVTAAFPPGATIAVTVGATTVMATSDNDPQVPDLYENSEMTSMQGSGGAVVVTVAGGTGTGAASVIVEWCSPSS